MQKFKSSEEVWKYLSFYDALTQKMTSNEISSLQALGKSFFDLVECLSQKLFQQRVEDAPLLSLTEPQFFWEIQVFVNHFIRTSCQSPSVFALFVKIFWNNLETPSLMKASIVNSLKPTKLISSPAKSKRDL